jgi:hypothetical protein
MKTIRITPRVGRHNRLQRTVIRHRWTGQRAAAEPELYADLSRAR